MKGGEEGNKAGSTPGGGRSGGGANRGSVEGDYEPHHGHRTETTKINLNHRSGGEKRWKPAEIAFDLWPLSS